MQTDSQENKKMNSYIAFSFVANKMCLSENDGKHCLWLLANNKDGGINRNRNAKHQLNANSHLI